MTQQQISALIRQHVTARNIDGKLVLCGLDDAAVAIHGAMNASIDKAMDAAWGEPQMKERERVD